ncbi:MAG: BatA domain-containing protein, partial [Gemmatimonas sp.]
MITLALPWVFGLAIAGALSIAALHLLSVQRPPELLLPTTRFLPERVVHAVARTNRPSDLALLLLRMAALLAAGLAVAGPRWRSASVSRIVLAVSDGGMRRDTASIRALVTDTSDPAVSGVRVVHVFADRSVNPSDDAATLIPL